MSSEEPTQGNRPVSPCAPARRRLAAGIGIAGIVLILAAIAWDVTELWSWDAFIEWKSQVDYLPFFVGLALLPLVGFPTTPLFMLAGATFSPAAALAGTAVSIALNLCLSHWLANRWLRAFVERQMTRWNLRWPSHSGSQALRFLIIVRLTPGVPTFLKNYVTALADIPFRVYLAVSWITTFLYASGLVVMGDSLVNQNPIEAVIGLAILLVAYLLAKSLKRRSSALRRIDPVKTSAPDQ